MPEIVGHPSDPLQPRTDDRRVFLDFPDADLRTELQVADFRDQRSREGEPLVRVNGIVAMLLQFVEQNQRLVERQWTDRVLQQKTEAVGR